MATVYYEKDADRSAHRAARRSRSSGTARRATRTR